MGKPHYKWMEMYLWGAAINFGRSGDTTVRHPSPWQANHIFFVFWLEIATTVHNDTGKCVPTTNAKRKVRHTIVFYAEGVACA